MSKFKELFQEAIPEFDKEDQAVVQAIGEYIGVLADDPMDMQQMFPDLPAESITRPVGEAQDLLKKVFEREQAAQARGAKKLRLSLLSYPMSSLVGSNRLRLSKSHVTQSPRSSQESWESRRVTVQYEYPEVIPHNH